jgi:hypothetical protein
LETLVDESDNLIEVVAMHTLLPSNALHQQIDTLDVPGTGKERPRRR